MGIDDEYGVATRPDGSCEGCRVPRISVNVHCYEPHLECVSHVLPPECKFRISDALSNGSAERALLITPGIETLGDSLESYPVGNREDLVISMNQVRRSIEAFGNDEEFDSIVVRIPELFLPCHPESTEISSWPYLTVECATFLHERFTHYRTNAPSVERLESRGGMWSHCTFFGIDPERRDVDFSTLEKRTVGELFNIPDQLADGEYSLVCAFIEMGLDCALVVPQLYNRS